MGRRVKNGGMRTTATPSSGRLIQAIYLQVAYSENTPPIKGPMTEPAAHTKPSIPIHKARSFNVVMSVNIISERASKPPPADPLDGAAQDEDSH